MSIIFIYIHALMSSPLQACNIIIFQASLHVCEYFIQSQTCMVTAAVLVLNSACPVQFRP